jgi:predicted nucleic acid-binding protein
MKGVDRPALVLDASVALSWCFDDEATAATREVLVRLDKDSAIAPSLLPLEIANVLALAERRKRISPGRIAEFVELIDTLAIEIEQPTSARVLHDVLNLARGEALTAYDASYLELAMRLGLPLASKDVALRRAALRLGVPLLGA